MRKNSISEMGQEFYLEGEKRGYQIPIVGDRKSLQLIFERQLIF
jgi:hypothetical protein